MSNVIILDYKKKLREYEHLPMKQMMRFVDEHLSKKLVIPPVTLYQLTHFAEAYMANTAKFKFIVNQLDDTQAHKIYEKIQKTLQVNPHLFSNFDDFDKHKKQCMVVIMIINKILLLNNLQQINQLEQFVNIPKDIINNGCNIQIFIDNEKVIFDVFSKRDYKWYPSAKRVKKDKAPYVLQFLRHACRDIGYELCAVRKHRENTPNEMTRIYSIKLHKHENDTK